MAFNFKAVWHKVQLTRHQMHYPATHGQLASPLLKKPCILPMTEHSRNSLGSYTSDFSCWEVLIAALCQADRPGKTVTISSWNSILWKASQCLLPKANKPFRQARQHLSAVDELIVRIWMLPGHTTLIAKADTITTPWSSPGSHTYQATSTVDSLLARNRLCDIDQMVLVCRQCQDHLPLQPNELIVCKARQLRRFQEIATDFCYYVGKYYLIVIDIYTHWPTIISMGWWHAEYYGTTGGLYIHSLLVSRNLPFHAALISFSLILLLPLLSHGFGGSVVRTLGVGTPTLWQTLKGLSQWTAGLYPTIIHLGSLSC